MAQQPRLVVRTIPVPSHPSGTVIALCTEAGEIFGMQESCILSSASDEPTRVTATFLVDGTSIRLAGGNDTPRPKV